MGLLDIFQPTNGWAANAPGGFGAQPSQFTQWVRANPYALQAAGQGLQGFFGGMAGATNAHDALVGATKGLNGVNTPAYLQLQLQKAQQDKEAADAKAKQNATVAWIQKNAPKYYGAVNAGVISPADAYKAALQDAGGSQSKPYEGTGMDAQNWNILLTGNPSSPEYAAAYSQVTQPKMTLQQTEAGLVPVYTTPNIPTGIRKPTWGASALPQQSQPQTQAPMSSGMGAPDGGLAPSVSGISTGPALPNTTAKPTEAQQRMTMLSTSLATSASQVLKGYDALSDTKNQIIGLGGSLTRPLQSADYQMATTALKSAISDIVPAISGAAFSQQELQQKIDAFTPKIGEKPETIAFKKRLFISYVQGIAQASNDPQAKATAQALLAQLTAADRSGVTPPPPAPVPQPAPAPSGNVISFPNGITVEPIN